MRPRASATRRVSNARGRSVPPSRTSSELPSGQCGDPGAPLRSSSRVRPVTTRLVVIRLDGRPRRVRRRPSWPRDRKSSHRIAGMRALKVRRSSLPAGTWSLGWTDSRHLSSLANKKGWILASKTLTSEMASGVGAGTAHGGLRTMNDGCKVGPEHRTSARKSAVILAGAASKGPFAAGALGVVAKHQAEFEIVCVVGTSSGALNAAVFAAGLRVGRAQQAAARLEELWRDTANAAHIVTVQMRENIVKSALEEFSQYPETYPIKLRMAITSLDGKEAFVNRRHYTTYEAIRHFQSADFTNKQGIGEIASHADAHRPRSPSSSRPSGSTARPMWTAASSTTRRSPGPCARTRRSRTSSSSRRIPEWPRARGASRRFLWARSSMSSFTNASRGTCSTRIRSTRSSCSSRRWAST